MTGLWKNIGMHLSGPIFDVIWIKLRQKKHARLEFEYVTTEAQY